MSGERVAHDAPVTLRREGGVAVVTLNRPASLNALDGETLDHLAAAVTTADADEEVGAILLCGAGRAFCAGADRKAVASLAGEEEVRRHADRMAKALLAVADARAPTIAAVQGYALGAGCGLVAVCDMAVAAPDAVFGFPELDIGVLPALVTPCLVRAVGRRQAFALLATCRRFGAAEAVAMGLAAQIAEADLAREARAVAARLAAGRAAVPRRLKSLLAAGEARDFAAALEAAREANVADRLEALAARDAPGAP